MSVHLVSLVFAPDDYSMISNTQNGITVNVYARRSQLSLGFGDFGLGVAQKALGYFIDYFGTSAAIPPKVDLIAIPGYPGGFASPAWGLNQFHEDNFLFSSLENSVLDKQNIVLRIAQEMASYWVGNYGITFF